MEYPWKRKELKDWSIAAMNNYYRDDRRFLFVVMTKPVYGMGSPMFDCIKEEGPDEPALWDRLVAQALKND